MLRFLNSNLGSIILDDGESFGIPGLQLVKLAENITVENATLYYISNTSVLYAEPNYISTIPPPSPSYSKFQAQDYILSRLQNTLVNDEKFSQQWGLTKIQANNAWDISTGTDSIIIALIDTGVDYSHPDLTGNIWRNPGEISNNGIDDEGNGYIDDIKGWNFVTKSNSPLDDNSHGTHCAGIIAAQTNNHIGVAGTLWNAKIIPIKTFDSSGKGDSWRETEAIKYADKIGAKIISCSWSEVDSTPLKNAIQDSPALFTFAAGNEGNDNDQIKSYPSSYDFPNIISVAATDPSDNLVNIPGWWASNYGKSSVDLAAPGQEIYSTILGNSYGSYSGTSMATPFVAGVAGLIKSKHPELTNAQIKSAILNNVDTVPSLNGKVASGGRLNAYKALKSLESSDDAGSISLQSNPPGAKIYVDGADTGFITPKTIPNIIIGNHTIRCSLNGYDDGYQNVNVIAGQTVSVQMIMNKTVVIPPGTNYIYVSTLGSYGSGNGQFNIPYGIAVDEARNRVYIADTWNHRIQAFDRYGNFITKWGSPGQFIYPFGIAVDKETGYIYTAEQLGNRVQVFSPDGTFIRKWGSSGTGNGQFDWSDCIAVDGARDRVYVTDTRNNRVQIFDRNGNFISKFGSFGSGNGQIKTPYGIAVNPINGYIYVCDPGNSRIQVFDFNGNYQKQFGTPGTGVSQFLDPLGVDIDDTGRVFAAETVNGRIQVFSDSGAYITQWGTFGTGNGQLNMPYDVAVDDINGYVYVADTENSRIQVFAPTTTPSVPPASITNLGNTTFQQTSITWTWIDPTSTDFSKVMVYMDGVFQENVTKGIRTYTASSLTPGTQHTIATRTVGTSGLINQTWVNDTARTAPDAPSFGSAFIQSTPSGAKIYLDYTDTGFVTPRTLSNLATGFHVIRCSLNGYDDTTQTVSITSGQTTNVTINLQKSGNVAPKADFVASTREGGSPLTVQFIDKSTNLPTSWTWTFGDGSTSNERNPTHTYLKSGIYSVKLKVSNLAGTNGLSRSGYIVVSNSGPTPTITPTTQPTTVPTTIVTTVPTTLPTTVPTTIITTIPTTQPTTVQTTVIPPNPPKSDFSASVTSGTNPLTVQFTDKSTNFPISWTWTFGDGSTSTEQNPSHTYVKSGTYSVKLKVSNLKGSSGLSRSNYILVSNAPTPAATT